MTETLNATDTAKRPSMVPPIIGLIAVATAFGFYAVKRHHTVTLAWEQQFSTGPSHAAIIIQNDAVYAYGGWALPQIFPINGSSPSLLAATDLRIGSTRIPMDAGYVQENGSIFFKVPGKSKGLIAIPKTSNSRPQAGAVVRNGTDTVGIFCWAGPFVTVSHSYSLHGNVVPVKGRAVTKLVLSPASAQAAIASVDGTVAILSAPTWQPTRTISTTGAEDIAFSASGDLFVGAGGGVTVYPRSGGASPSTIGSGIPLSAIAVSPDGELLAIARMQSSMFRREAEIDVYDVGTQKLLGTFNVQARASENYAGPTAMTFDPSGQMLAIGTQGEIVHVFRWRQKDEIFVTPPLGAAIQSVYMNETQLAVMDSSGSIGVASYDLASNR